MRVLVVYCHPVPESFCAAIRDRVLQTIENNGHDARLLDLHAIGFDPVMGADERRRYNDITNEDHPLPEHADHLRWAEAMLFVYPTWWYGLPAMLKGWLDRVWTPEVAFSINKDSGVIRPLMTHITKLGIITTCGAPGWWSHVVGHPGKRTIMRGMRALFAKKCKRLFCAHYLMDVSTDETRRAFLNKVEMKVSKFLRPAKRA